MNKTKRYIDSEHYRQQLVKDGDRRFQEWHTAFVSYQKRFMQALSKTRQR